MACYVQGLDCLSLARSQGDDERLNHISSRLGTPGPFLDPRDC